MFVPPTISCETATDAALASLLTECGRWRAQLEAFEATVLAEFERRRVATAEGCADTAAWLARHAQSAAGAARSRVERATALAALPGASAAFAAGHLGSDHAAVVARATRVVGADVVAAAEDELLGWVAGTTPEQFGRRVRRWINRHRIDTGTTPADATRAERRLSLRTDAVAGTGHLHAELPVADHALVANTLWGLVEEQWRAEHGNTAPLPDRVELTSQQRLADALVEMARRAAGATVADRHRARPTVTVLLDADTLAGRLHEGGHCELADGTPLGPDTARRLACEADLIPVVLGGASQPLDVGRARRLATAAQRSAMLARSRTCEWPHCTTAAAWCDAHHLQPWENRGRTDLANLAWLCAAHHHQAHEGHWRLTRHANGRLTATSPPASQPARHAA
jgi:hypothetical protein